MRSARFTLEDQVGGLVDHPDRTQPGRVSSGGGVVETAEPERYDLTAKPTLAIRATRASDDLPERHVA